jgi:predicted nucleic acid-binding protein
VRAVLDASAFLDEVLADVPHGVGRIEVPAVFDVEIVSALRRRERTGELDASGAEAILTLWGSLKVKRHAIPRFRARMWEMRHNVTSYDAAYVALAEALGIPLVTTDRRLARAAEPYCDVIVPS